MNKNFSLKFKISDIFAIALSILVGVILIVSTIIINNTSLNEQRIAHVRVNNEVVLKYDTDLNKLSSTKTIVLTPEEYPTLLGDFTIEMDREKGIRVINVTCPNHTCINQGWVNIDNLPIVCIPNDVIVLIEAKDASSIVL